MKSTLLFVFALMFSMQVSSQEIPSIKVGEERLGVTSLDIKVEIVGNIATITYDMLFYNPTNQVLEGELNFPLGEGQNVSRLVLEVNGKLREAVVVEKEIGRVAFEAVVRRGVDPVLLEKGTGNNYKARIYPIPRRGYKRVVLAYEQELIFNEGSHYFQMPLGFKKNLDNFSIELNIFGQEIKPEITKGGMQNFSFKKFQNSYIAKFSKKNFTPGNDLTIKIPQEYNKIKSIDFEDYIYVYQTINAEKRIREKAKKITLFWDTSLSMKSRDIQKELQLLNQYFEYLNTVNVEVIKFSNEIRYKKSYKITNGNWIDLKQELINTVYDGGTSYNCILSNYKADEILLFSDGMNNLSDFIMIQKQPVFVVNSIIKANHSQLNEISEASNGKYINLKNNSVQESLNKLQYESYKFLGVTSNNSKLEIYPNTPQTVTTDFSIAVNNYCPNDELILHFGFGNEITKEQTVILESNVTNSLVKRFWAQKKLDMLQAESELNKDAIIKHSKFYSLVSNHTSLIVLERVWDYVKYKITPPEELLEEYNRIISRNNGKRIVSVTNETNEENEDSQQASDTHATNQVSTQTGNISGVISDDSGIPLPGVNVLIKGTTQGTQTDFDGRYSINARTGDILTFSYIGLITLETTIGSSNNINISMQEDASSLDEVVVTAQGIKREKKALGYAVSMLEADDLEQRAEGDVARILSGKASGLQITSQSGISGSATNVIIRGYSSINGSNQALFIVDGVPFSSDNNTIGSFASGNVGSSRFLDLDPNNIESINVLKGLAAATIYGSAGRNGVILITTKAGSPFSNGGSNYSRSIYNKRQKNRYKGRLKVYKQKLNTPYLNELSVAKSAKEAYAIYLKQRKKYLNFPAYYIDVYDFLKQWKKEDYSMMILSNIAELDFDNYELLRVFAYKLEEGNNFGLAAFIYKQVLKLRPEDSQSYRDLGLAYQEIGMSQEAFNLLNKIVSEEIYSKQGRRRFVGMQSISKNEINNLLQSNNEIDSEKLNNHKKINTTYDIRIVIDWNHNDTDIDLHIIDPFKEECYYLNEKTVIGGELSRDMTQGFGPEEFTLRNAKNGEYYVKVNYFGDRYQKIENPTFMKVTIFRNYGKPNEIKDIKVIRLTKRNDKIFVSKLEI
ncbi:MAG: carboxypeptidase-like regulatory domain-containing protein [Flavobacteriaceae bacterium]|nr:carboxypeptidase-like regulatory domain-containing protein [Flavobacteriaceae bacterium]